MSLGRILTYPARYSISMIMLEVSPGQDGLYLLLYYDGILPNLSSPEARPKPAIGSRVEQRFGQFSEEANMKLRALNLVFETVNVKVCSSSHVRVKL